jgi:hypothetical protein
MRTSALSFAILGVCLIATLQQPAQAQNPRSWVASPPDGNDGNLCTRSSPCATFNRAQVQTNDGGEINCVDQGEYGRLRVTKSITIDCEAVQGRIVSTDPGSAILVRALVAPTSQVVVLRGLDISGVGIGGVGIGADNVAEVHIEKCVIHDFGLSGSGWGIVGGVIFNPTQQLFISDTVVRNNGTSSS